MGFSHCLVVSIIVYYKIFDILSDLTESPTLIAVCILVPTTRFPDQYSSVRENGVKQTIFSFKPFSVSENVARDIKYQRTKLYPILKVVKQSGN